MSMMRSAWLVPAAAIVLLLLAVAWMAGVFDEKLGPDLKAQLEAPDVENLVIGVRAIPYVETVAGTISAKQATFISSRVLAQIADINVRAGDFVETGDLLIQLDQVDAKARLSQAENQILATSARSIEAQLSLERALSLHERGLIAAADVDKARANNDALAAELSASRELAVERKAALQFTEIRSPIDGRVVDRFAEPGDTATPGTTLLSIYNPLTLRVEAPVREHLALALDIGQQLAATIPAVNKQVMVHIDEVVPAADPGSRSFLIKARLQFDELFRPGMYAQVEIPGGTEELIVLPTSSIAQVGQLDVVWVIQQDGISRRFIRLGKNLHDGSVVVLSGLRPGERVLASPPLGK